ncbi:hypothetical protein MSWHS_1988 [Methanosarcina sp. WWM596]|nr:hypothetical protein MSWHS_1988 [Methanosarcina sp. WWM596]
MLKCIYCLSSLEKKENRYICQNCGRAYSTEDGISSFLNKKHQESHFPKNSFDRLYKNENDNFWFLVRNIIIGTTIQHYLPLKSRLIEVGCGTGFVSKHLKGLGYQVECADLYLEGLKYSQKRNAGNAYYQFNLYDPLFVEEFDGVCAFDVLEHIDDDRLALKNMYKGLKPGGFLLLTVPACKKLWSNTDELAEHKRRYSAKELKEKVESTGFKILKLSYFMTFLFPFIAFSRMFANFLSLHRKSETIKSKTQVFNEIEINPVLNSLFYLIFRIEAQFIPYLDFRFGSSLLLVAIKRRD